MKGGTIPFVRNTALTGRVSLWGFAVTDKPLGKKYGPFFHAVIGLGRADAPSIEKKRRSLFKVYWIQFDMESEAALHGFGLGRRQRMDWPTSGHTAGDSSREDRWRHRAGVVPDTGLQERAGGDDAGSRHRRSSGVVSQKVIRTVLSANWNHRRHRRKFRK